MSTPRPAASGTDWTRELIARLRALWNEGHSAVEIGRRMGLSKNAVVGKAHRLDLPPRRRSIRRGGHEPRAPEPRRVHGPASPPRSTASGPTPASREAPARPAISATLACPTLDPSGRPCCWPIGEPGRPGFRFCGRGAATGKPYCPEHVALAYVPASAARERPDGPTLDRLLRDLSRTP